MNASKCLHTSLLLLVCFAKIVTTQMDKAGIVKAEGNSFVKKFHSSPDAYLGWEVSTSPKCKYKHLWAWRTNPLKPVSYLLWWWHIWYYRPDMSPHPPPLSYPRCVTTARSGLTWTVWTWTRPSTVASASALRISQLLDTTTRISTRRTATAWRTCEASYFSYFTFYEQPYVLHNICR